MQCMWSARACFVLGDRCCDLNFNDKITYYRCFHCPTAHSSIFDSIISVCIVLYLKIWYNVPVETGYTGCGCRGGLMNNATLSCVGANKVCSKLEVMDAMVVDEREEEDAK